MAIMFSGLKVILSTGMALGCSGPQESYWRENKVKARTSRVYLWICLATDSVVMIVIAGAIKSLNHRCWTLVLVYSCPACFAPPTHLVQMNSSSARSAGTWSRSWLSKSSEKCRIGTARTRSWYLCSKWTILNLTGIGHSLWTNWMMMQSHKRRHK